MEAAKPKCSGCGAEGLKKVFFQAAPATPNFLIASCADCGVIHSVFSKPYEPPQMPRPNPVEIIR